VNNFIHQHILISKIFNRISYYLNWVYFFIPLSLFVKLKSNKVSRKFSRKDFETQLDFLLGDFQNYSQFTGNDEDVQVILKCAEQTVRHEFDYLGSGFKKIDPIDWHIDFKTGFRWPKGKFYKQYTQIDLNNDADVKVPWELSRCHHLLWLGQAYLITKDEKFGKEVVDQIDWWINDNPLMRSINWTCAMDVAIRSVNWLFTLNMIKNSKHVSNKFVKKTINSLFEHGWFIFNNLEKWYPYSANHYAANLSGLLFLGKVFSSTRSGRNWYHYALKEYYFEIRQQILPSGAHFERTISYHRLMTELFVFPYFMLYRSNETIPLDIKIRIKSMFNFIDAYTKQNGLSPNVGDNDDGRLLPFVKRDFRRHDYMLMIAREVFGIQYESLWNKNLTCQDCFFFMDMSLPENIKYTSTNFNFIKDHRDAGFVIYKDPKLYLFFSNTSISGYPDFSRLAHGSHSHSDGLSFELSIGGTDIFIDPGSYLYTASVSERNRFRSTIMHNTWCIDGESQPKLSQKHLFSVSHFDEVDPIKILENNENIEVTGTRFWILKNEKKISHKRIIKIKSETCIEIIDYLTCKVSHSFNFNLHLFPGLVCESTAEGFLLKKNNLTCVKLFFYCQNDFVVDIENNNCSPSYGVLIENETISVKLVSDSDFSFTTLIIF
jgi:hypothetical protein